MHEIDFLPVGDATPGDAIAMRFTRPDTGALVHVLIDAGFKGNQGDPTGQTGKRLVKHVRNTYGVERVELVILTHPDGDHIGGMGDVFRELAVEKLWLQDLAAHGGAGLRAAPEVRSLISLAQQRGAQVLEPWAGAQEFGGAITVLGPDKPYYEQLVAEQVSGPAAPAAATKAAMAGIRAVWDRLAEALGDEIPFPEKEVTPRNNSSIITLLKLGEQRMLFTGDAGVPALSRAWDKAEEMGLAGELAFVQVPHHGSRRNASSAFLDRVLGPTGQSPARTAYASVPARSEKHPSGRVMNAYERRGCATNVTGGKGIYFYGGVPLRPGWYPLEPMGPMIEEPESDD
jgi:beta-lactamase superfamily II metal-dependent hydrolase